MSLMYKMSSHVFNLTVILNLSYTRTAISSILQQSQTFFILSTPETNQIPIGWIESTLTEIKQPLYGCVIATMCMFQHVSFHLEATTRWKEKEHKPQKSTNGHFSVSFGKQYSTRNILFHVFILYCRHVHGT